ncbi:Major Facilitator Superfamily [Aspergillus sclerotialis]|uniref:Major Facilitator Superfamily n=1 Tax=Aspergillus sclerotialis TaxID=2070753 RepID=A0A3A2ZTK1_9EURO|nr:Major Facilitator Superfamily [Aspergillus sclerotialis]
MSGTEEVAIDLKQDQETLPEYVTSEAKDSSDEALNIALRNYVPGSKEEKRLVRKLDMWMIPMLWWMCVLCYLDRNNIGNADAAGMSDDLGLNPSGTYYPTGSPHEDFL